jgi:hypothetical protein
MAMKTCHPTKQGLCHSAGILSGSDMGFPVAYHIILKCLKEVHDMQQYRKSG